MERINELLSSKPSRRTFLAGAGATGAAALVAGCSGGKGVTPTPTPPPTTLTDADILTFALNLEYLEAEFYLRAATGAGLGSADNGGGAAGSVTGSTTAVPFTSSVIQQYAVEIAQNELNHVRFLRSALTAAKVTPVAAPPIDFTNAFTAAAIAAGVIPAGMTFNPFADQNSFLLGAFVFEDVGVTAYTGAAPLLTTPAYLTAAAGIQAVEAYHAAEIRTIISAIGGATAIAAANMISALRGSLGGGNETPISSGSLTMASTIVAADSTGLAYARTTDQVLHIVYASAGGAGVKSGGFFPNGLNGNISVTTS